MTAGRVFSLRELDRPFFGATVAAMKKLREEFPGFDLGPGARGAEGADVVFPERERALNR